MSQSHAAAAAIAAALQLLLLLLRKPDLTLLRLPLPTMLNVFSGTSIPAGHLLSRYQMSENILALSQRWPAVSSLHATQIDRCSQDLNVREHPGLLQALAGFSSRFHLTEI